MPALTCDACPRLAFWTARPGCTRVLHACNTCGYLAELKARGYLIRPYP